MGKWLSTMLMDIFFEKSWLRLKDAQCLLKYKIDFKTCTDFKHFEKKNEVGVKYNLGSIYPESCATSLSGFCSDALKQWLTEAGTNRITEYRSFGIIY